LRFVCHGCLAEHDAAPAKAGLLAGINRRIEHQQIVRLDQRRYVSVVQGSPRSVISVGKTLVARNLEIVDHEKRDREIVQNEFEFIDEREIIVPVGGRAEISKDRAACA
jgi:hypothetical protein